MSFNVDITTVAHGLQRYDTLGDWLYEDGRWKIRVSELGDWRMEFAIAIHELVESALCRNAGISQQLVDNFDFVSDAEEPGDEPTAPYHRQHVYATVIEYIVLTLLGVSVKDYEDKCRKHDSTSSPKAETAQGSLVDS